MSFFEFPNARTYDSDLGWLIWAMKKLIGDMTEFTEINSIKFGDPINWNIATQYEPTTIVVDGEGNGYISRKAVPAGIALTDSDYWTRIFNFSDITDAIRESIAVNAGNSATTPVALSANDLVWWNGNIYKVLYDIPAGTAFIDGTNVVAYTVNRRINDLSSEMGDFSEEIGNINTALGALDTRIDGVVGSVEDEAEARTAADNALNERIDGVVGSVEDEAEARTAADNAINERIDAISRTSLVINVKDYGAAGDGVTIDTDAIRAALAATLDDKSTVFFPNGIYLIDGNIRVYSNTHLLFDANAVVKIHRTNTDWMRLSFCLGENGNSDFATEYNGVHNVTFENMKFDGGYTVDLDFGNTPGGGTIGASHAQNISFINCDFTNIVNDHYLDLAGCKHINIENCSFHDGTYSGTGSYECINTGWATSADFPYFGTFDGTPTVDVNVENCYFYNLTGTSFALNTHNTLDSVADIENYIIKGCTFRNMARCIRMTKGHHLIIDGNTFENVANFEPDAPDQYAVLIQKTQNVVITSNSFYNVKKHCLKVENFGGTDTSYVLGCIITGNAFRTINGQVLRARYINLLIFANNIIHTAKEYVCQNSYIIRGSIQGNMMHNVASAKNNKPFILDNNNTGQILDNLANNVSSGYMVPATTNQQIITRNGTDTVFSTYPTA